MTVALVEQPYRVAGRHSPAPAAQLDAVWTAVLERLRSALHAQTRLPEAATILDALAAERLETRGYRAMSAQIGWERGSCLMERGAISDAIDTFTQSRAAVERLRERNLIASMDSLLAYALDCAGDMRAAWLARRRAFENLARAGNDVSTLVVIASSASTAATAKRWDIAEPMLALAIARAADSKNALVAAHCYVELAFMDVTVVGGSSEFAINERVVPAVRAPRPPTAISDRSTSSRSTPWPLSDVLRVSRGSMRD